MVQDMDKVFVPLHVHSMYSRLIGGDGFCFPRELAQRAKDIGCPAIALTDHGTMAGTAEFYRDCQKIGIKPILGTEAYITPMGHSLDERVVYDIKDMRGKPGYVRSNYHLILLAKDDTGWRNLTELSKQSFARGYYYKPRIDHELLKEHHEGIICSAACILGEIANLAWCDDYARMREVAQWYQEVFGEDYYLEVMYHGLDMERKALAPVRDLGKELGIKVIATNDSHYSVKSEYKLHKALMLDKMHKSFADADVSGSFFGEDDGTPQRGIEEEGGDSNPIFETSSELYIKDWDEMVSALAIEGATEEDVASELATTLEIAAKCNYELPIIDPTDMSAYYTPVYPVEKDLQYGAFKESQFEIRQSTVDAIIDEMHKDGREGDKLEDFLDDHEMLSLRFLMWMCDKGLKENVLPKLEARGEALPMEFWCENPPEGFSIRHTHNSPDELWIREQMQNGLSVDDMIQVYQDRIDYEVAVVVRKGFIDYFSVVQNYANFTKLNGSVMGPGRGSGGGSLLLYLLSITSIDPIPNKLLFFRFLNPDRKGYPDVDLDWSADFRDNRLKPYLREFYGDEYCAQVATYMYYWGKAAIKASARILFPMPESVQIGTTLADALDDKPKLDLNKELDGSNPQFEELVNSRPEYRQTIELAKMIQGRLSGESIHASAYIVSPKKLTDIVPLGVNKDERARAQKDNTEIKNYIIQYPGDIVQDVLGLVKLDLLCVVDLEMMEMTCKTVERIYGCKINLERIPLDDAAIWSMLQDHLVAGLFQLDGSEGMARVMDQVRPENIENINAIVALYRPGPMDYIPNYVEGKNHPEKVHYLDERLKPILQDTYGVVCVADGTLVSTENGKKAIEDVAVGDWVYAEDGHLHNVSAFYDNGVKETLRIRGTYGEELICTPDHKILTSDGWVEARDLKPGMLMMGGNPYKMAGTLRSPEPFDWEHWFIGLFLADGYSAKSTPTIACSSKEYAEELARQSREHFPSMEGIRTYCGFNGTGGSTWYVSFAQKAGKNGSFSSNYQENELNILLRKYGLWHCTRDKKRLPSNYSYSMLIGMFEGDGCGINKRLNLKYEGLARDFYEAALSYGLNVSLYKRDENSWTVSISGDIASIFPFNIRHYDPRVERRCGTPAKDIYIPRKSLVGYPNLIKKSQVLRHGQLEAAPAIGLSSAKANGLTDDDYAAMHQEWSKVLSITPAGSRHVYDITVDDVHQFIAGNIIIKNCYQEEAMQITQAIGKFSGGEADTYRKFAAKKYPDKLAQMGDTFISRAVENDTDPKVAEELWTQLVKFGSYAFNRSHSAAYALIAYRGAFLKAHFPECFFASLCTLKPKAKKTNKVPEYLNEARQMGVTVKPPHVNYSEAGFDVPEKGVIAFGLGGIGGVGASAQVIVDERHARGPFKDFSDFVTRVPREVGKGALLPLMQYGALDGLGWSRKAMVESIDQIVAFRKSYFDSKERRAVLAVDLFDMGGDDGDAQGDGSASEGADVLLTPPFETEYNERQMLELEKRNLGLYLSGSPEDYKKISRYSLEREMGQRWKDAQREARMAARSGGAADVPVRPVHVGDIDSLPDRTAVELICTVSDPVSKLKPNPRMFKSGKGCSINVHDWGVLEESRFGFSPHLYKSRLTMFSRVLEKVPVPRPGDLIHVRGRVNVDPNGEWPNSVIVDELEVIPEDASLMSSMSREQLVGLSETLARLQESLGDPSADIYMIPALTFPSQDMREAFLASPVTDGFRGTGHVLVAVEGNALPPETVSLRQTVAMVRHAERFGARVQKVRFPKAQSAIERMKLMKG